RVTRSITRNQIKRATAEAVAHGQVAHLDGQRRSGICGNVGYESWTQSIGAGTWIAVGANCDVLAGEALVWMYDRKRSATNRLTDCETAVGESDGRTDAH